MRQQQGSSPRPQLSHAIAVAQELERWCHERDWQGADPYDGMNASLPRRVLRRPLPLRALTQTVKRSPIDLRPALGIRPGLSAATLSLAISAYARNGFLSGDVARVRLGACIERLEALRCPGFAEPCWGYHFDVQTRVFFYPRTQPNTIATAFAGLGLLDAFAAHGDRRWRELAIGVGEFFLRHVPQTRDGRGAYFGYLPGDRTPIHNASMLICALLARLSHVSSRQDFRAAAEAGVKYTVARQRPDGTWPYGEQPHLDWVDGFHTGYVLDSLLTCVQHGIGASPAEEAWRNGLRFYAEALIEPDGMPRYTPTSRYPIDGQCVAQAIESLSRGSDHAPKLAARSWDVLQYALGDLARGDGSFAFQRERWWVNRTPHLRWVQAPMLKALTVLIEFTAKAGGAVRTAGSPNPQ